jgi:hypothetical protein
MWLGTNFTHEVGASAGWMVQVVQEAEQAPARKAAAKV